MTQGRKNQRWSYDKWVRSNQETARLLLLQAAIISTVFLILFFLLTGRYSV